MSLRFERTGGPPDLEASFKEFALYRLRGSSLDDNAPVLSAKGKFPDFECFGGLLRIEVKTLMTSQRDRINETVQNKVDPNEWPIFYGSRRVDVSSLGLSNAEEITRALNSKLGRTIETILKNANKQFKDYAVISPRQNTLNVCVLLNSSLLEYDPRSTAWLIRKRMLEGGNEPRFSYIDASLFISEKHVLKDVTEPTFVQILVEGYGVDQNLWKSELLNLILNRWSLYRTGTAAYSMEMAALRTVEIHDIPNRMTRNQKWVLDYERHPYLSNTTLDDLRRLLARTIVMFHWGFVKGNWVAPPTERSIEYFRLFSDITCEANRRALDAREWSPNTIPLSYIVMAMPPDLPQSVREDLIKVYTYIKENEKN